MPELPEVETIKNGLLPHVINKKITGITVRQSKLRWNIPKDISQTVQNNFINNITRRSKYLIFNTIPNKNKNNNNNNLLIIHLGMSGTLQLVDYNSPLKKHDHVDIILDNKKILRYNDPRRFGAIFTIKSQELIDSNIEQHIRFKHLGPEPLTDNFNSEYLYQLAQKSKTPIKNFIMNNTIVVGVGNIYATEALFYSRIHPVTIVNKLTIKQWDRVIKEIKKVLKKAIKCGGTTLKDFLHLDGKPGYFKQELAVYGRAGQPCINCHNMLTFIKQQGRTTVYCSTCQN